jgi:hypothetical protein
VPPRRAEVLLARRRRHDSESGADEDILGQLEEGLVVVDDEDGLGDGHASIVADSESDPSGNAWRRLSSTH